jgi:hypothetical protein
MYVLRERIVDDRLVVDLVNTGEPVASPRFEFRIEALGDGASFREAGTSGGGLSVGASRDGARIAITITGRVAGEVMPEAPLLSILFDITGEGLLSVESAALSIDGMPVAVTAFPPVGLGAANHPPIATDDRVVTGRGEDVLIDVLANDADPDRDSLSILLLDQPVGGVISVVDGKVLYRPLLGGVSTDRFTYEVSDGNGGTARATVEIEFDEPPVALDDRVAIRQFTPLIGFDPRANDRDPDDDLLTLVAVEQPANGRVFLLDDGTLAYAPPRGFTGVDVARYTVADPRGNDADAAVEITVRPDDPDAVAARFVAYLYEAALGRAPDVPGLNFWIRQGEAGLSERALAGEFLRSPEFAATLGAPGSLSDAAFVEGLYENVLDREADPAGLEHWLSVLERPAVTRIDLLTSFAESPENLIGSPLIATLEEQPGGLWDYA